ncbi:MAG: DUF3467 domain-containing protein [Bacteroides sp.]|jgi:hypothetical protein
MAERENNNDEKNFSIDIPEDLFLGVYSNLVIISHSSSEFVLDFSRIMPGHPGAKVVSRVVMTPDHAKRLFRALGDNLQRYEQAHGEIDLHEGENEDVFMNALTKCDA